MKVIVWVLVCLLALSSTIWAQDSQQTITIPQSEYDALKARLDQLEQDVADLKAAQSPAQLTEEPAPGETDPGTPAEIIGGGSTSGVPQTELPDISVIGNVVGRASSGDPDSEDQLAVHEVEVALQSYLYPQIRADAIIALDEGHDHSAELEEGYISFLQLGDTQLNARLGKKRLDFGKTNPVHPHHRLYVNAPRVVENFLGDHGLIANGISLGYLLPTEGSLFASLDIGAWKVSAHEHEHAHEDGEEEEHEAHAPGFDDNVYSARLWTSRPLSEISELEVGLSGIRGKGSRLVEVEGEEDHFSVLDDITLLGLDLTYKNWPEAHKRWLLQSEIYRHRHGGDNRFGYYVFGNHKWDKYWDAGLLYDWSERPFPSEGHDSGISAILTHSLTETTKLRLQYTYADRNGIGRVHEGFLQAIWGIGPHSHPLE